MHNLDARDPLALGQQLMSVLEGGRRVATYKLATLLALLDYAVEHTPSDPNAVVEVDLDDLSDRVIALYWRQVRDLDGHHLRQSTTATARIPDAVRKLKASTSPPRFEIAVDVARRREPEMYASTRTAVKLTLVQQPLHRLQRVTKNQDYTCFLYDDRWMHDKVSAAAIAQQGNVISLFAGVAHALARLSALLKPALQIAWVDDVRRLNPFLRDDAPDLAGHLFGIDRVSLYRARLLLSREFGSQCFYCDGAVGAGAHVDHVLPWSRVGIDGLANLVLACLQCNGDKSNLLPAPVHVQGALDRGQERLDALAASIDWPSQYERTAAAARGLYSTQPANTPMWLGRKSIELLQPDFQWGTPRTMWSSKP
ncbi:UNVERIFIED_CONTAM: HNH endonuclease [Williamsia faeni]